MGLENEFSGRKKEKIIEHLFICLYLNKICIFFHWGQKNHRDFFLQIVIQCPQYHAFSDPSCPFSSWCHLQCILNSHPYMASLWVNVIQIKSARSLSQCSHAPSTTGPAQMLFCLPRILAPHALPGHLLFILQFMGPSALPLALPPRPVSTSKLD